MTTDVSAALGVRAQPAPWFGRTWEHRQAAIALTGSIVAGLLYRQGTIVFSPDFVPGPVEFWGTVTSLWSVWITQRRNVLAMPAGIVSVALMGMFFLDIGLLGQAALHWGYYLPIQFWAWHQWTRGGEDASELTVTRLTGRQLAITVAAMAGFTLVFGWLLDAGWDSAVHTYWDASIVAASVVAMVLLSRKKPESWWLWIGPVNVSAIGLYLSTGARMFAALYVLFLVMAFFGLAKWHRAAREGVA